MLEWRQLAEAEIDLHRCAGRRRSTPTHRPRPHPLRHGGRQHRPAFLHRSQPAEHPHPHGGRRPHPPRLHRRAGPRAGQRRLLADRASPARPCRRYPAAARELRATARTSMPAPPARYSACRWQGMDSVTRRRAKAINFGIIYGISAFGLAASSASRPARRAGYIDAYFARYPGIRAYMERTKEEARIHGFVATPSAAAAGSRASPTRTRPAAAMPSARRSTRRCKAAPPTSSSAPWSACPRPSPTPASARACCLQVHDELLFEAPEDEADAAGRGGPRGDGKRRPSRRAAGGGDRPRAIPGRRRTEA